MKSNFNISKNGKFLTYKKEWKIGAQLGDTVLKISYGNRVNPKNIGKVVEIKKDIFPTLKVLFENGKTENLYEDNYTVLTETEVEFIKKFYIEAKNKPAIENKTKCGFKIKGKSIYLTKKQFSTKENQNKNIKVKVGDIFIKSTIGGDRILVKNIFKIVSLEYETKTYNNKTYKVILATIEYLNNKKVDKCYGPGVLDYKLTQEELEDILKFYND